MTSAELIALLAADIAEHGSRPVRVVGPRGTAPVVEVNVRRPTDTAVLLRIAMDVSL